MRKHFCAVLFASLLSLHIPAAAQTIVNRTGKTVIPSGNASYGGPYEFNWQAMPTVLTDIATVTAHLSGYCMYNSTGAPVTLTIQTKDMVPLPLPLSGALAAGATACFSFSQGLRSNGGFSVQAGGVGVYYGMVYTN